MTYVEKIEQNLQKQVIPQNMQPDFSEFWQENIRQLREIPIEVQRKKLETPYEKAFITWELTYNTHDDTKIHAWFSVPTGATEKLPCVVFYHGGGSQKELYPGIMAAGVCCFAMDVRGEGGTSIDRAVYTSCDTNGKLMSCGVLDKNNFFMRNIYMDAVRAIDVAATLPEVDSDRIVTYGGSQGGALSIVASALSGRSQKCYSGITSYCCLQQRVELGSGILSGVTEHLRKYPLETDAAMETLTYFDINNMVSLLRVPVLFCMGLADPVCLPKFVYSAYHHVTCEKAVDMYPFVQHKMPQEWLWKVHGEFAKL